MIKITRRDLTGVIYHEYVQPVYQTRCFAVTKGINDDDGRFVVTHIPTGYKLPAMFTGCEGDIPMLSRFCDLLDEAFDWCVDDGATGHRLIKEREGLGGDDLITVVKSIWESLGDTR